MKRRRLAGRAVLCPPPHQHQTRRARSDAPGL